MSGRAGNIIRIGWREFYSTAFNPIVLALLVIGLIFIFINGAFGQVFLTEMQRFDVNNDAFISGFRGVYAAVMVTFAIISGFLGVLSVSEERGRGSMKVLLCKPVYKTDVVIGKIVGLGMFMLSLAVVMHMLTGLILMIFFREPASATDYLGRLAGFILSSFLQSMLIIGFSLFIGMVVRNVLLSTATIAIYVFFDFLGANVGAIVNMIPVLPSRFLTRILIPANDVAIFDSGVPVSTWFELAAPHILLMALVVVLVLLVDCAVFSRQQEDE